MRNIEATGTMYGKQLTVKQVQKRTARKLYDQGKNVYFQACNLRPFGVWQSLMLVTNLNRDEISFDELCTEYGWYNLDSERGKYISFYVDMEDLKS